MLWKEVKSWAKSHGYETIKSKDDNEYYWKKTGSDDLNDGGIAKSVSKLALAVYNHMTENKWIDHQNEYRDKQNETSINTDL